MTKPTTSNMQALQVDKWTDSEAQDPSPLDLSQLIESNAFEPEPDLLEQWVEWWQKELEGAPPIHDLPTDFARPSKQSYDIEFQSFDWDEAFAAKLRELGRQHDLSLNMVVLAGFAALVWRYTEQEVVVLGLPTFAGDDDDASDSHFAGILPVRFDFSGSVTFEALLDQVRESTLAAMERSLPFEQLVEHLDLERADSHHPVVQLLFGPCGPEDGRLEEIVGLDLDGKDKTANFDLSVFCHDTSDGVDGYAAYSADLFEADTIDRLLSHLHNLLESAADKPDEKLGGLSLPTEKERRLILDEWNDTDIPVDLDRSFPEIFENQVDKTPDKIAVVEPDGSELTYRQLDEQANQVANYLIERGIEAEDVVAICVERGLDLVVGILGIMKSGGAYLPINPTFPEKRINFILDETSPPIALTQSDLEYIFDSTDSELVRFDADWSTIQQQPKTRPEVDIRPGDLAYIVYTSGSTGRPKGPMIEHGNVANLAATLGPAFGVEPDDRVSQFASETFDATIWEFAIAFTAGATLVLLPHGRSLLGLELGKFLQEQRITMAPLPPAVVPDIPSEMAEGVEKMIVAGEACPAKVVDNWAPGRRFVNGYGPRETTGYATYAVCEPTGEAPPIGKPLGNYKVYVLDENKELAPIGVYGELYIGGPGVGRGYLERPELNAEKFIPDPFNDEEGARMYRTGDIARWRSDGQLEFRGRRDFQVQLRGFRVELGAIEKKLREHGAVQHAVATKQKDHLGQERLVAYVSTESQDSKAELSDKLEKILEGEFPDYMVPSKIMVLDELPLNTTGKVDRHALPEPDFGRSVDEDELAEPRDEREQKLADGWKDLLGLEVVGVHENFFDLGGTSIMIAQVVYQIKELFDVEVPMRAFFDTPTIAAIAELIEEIQHPDKHVSELCFNPTLDLEEESQLASDITADAPVVDNPTDPENILLTGATGFVGAHLLADLLEETDADIYCLIRGRDVSHLYDRLDEAFDYFSLDHDLLDDRVTPVVGDLAADKLGLDDPQYNELASTVDAIYHNGAKVDQVRSYEDMKPPNVAGTEKMLRFAAKDRVKPFHFVSTTGSVYYPSYASEGEVPEDAPAGPLPKLPNGYMQTKCVGEHMVDKAIDRGIPGSIYRLGAVMGHTETGVCESDDFTYSIIRTAVDLGLADNLNPNYMITPVDFVARSITSLSHWVDGLDRVYHVTHPEPTWSLDLIDMLRDMGYSIDVVSFDDYVDRLLEQARQGGETPMLRFLPYLTQRVPGETNYKAQNYYIPVDWDTDNLEKGLAEMGQKLPPSVEELVSFYVENLIDEGYIPAPD